MAKPLLMTLDLADKYRDAPDEVRWGWASRAVGVVLRHGSRSDAEVLLPVFLKDPEACEKLIPVFARHGDPALAERLLAASVEGGRLREGVPTEVLHAVGCLGYEPAERTLWEYVERNDGSMDACLGLLHLPCRGLRTDIARVLERHAGSAWFPEFLPALATKTGDPSWLQALVAWGEHASDDCNGGLVLGVALHGDAARAEFLRMLWNPRWAAHGDGTGASHWAYAGARVLGLDLAELYTDVVVRLKSDADTKAKRHCVRTFTALLARWADRRWAGLHMAPDPMETREEMSGLVFEWSTPHTDDSLIALVKHVLPADADDLLRKLHSLERELELRAESEAELREFTAG